MVLHDYRSSFNWHFLEIMRSETSWLWEWAMHGTWGVSDRFLSAGILEFAFRWGRRMFEGNVTVIAFDFRELILLDLSGGSEFFRAKWSGSFLIFKRRGWTQSRVNDTGVGSREMSLLRNVCEYEVRRLVHFFDFLLNLKLLQPSHHYHITHTFLVPTCVCSSGLLIVLILRSRKRKQFSISVCNLFWLTNKCEREKKERVKRGGRVKKEDEKESWPR